MIVHVHVPKTGGSSLRMAFRQWYGDENVSHRGDTPVISDHFDRKQGDFLEEYPRANEMKFVTFLRDPFTRLISFYFHWKRHQQVGVHGTQLFLKDYAQSLDEFIESSPLDFSAFLPLGEYPEHFDDFLFVGIMEKFGRCLDSLADVLGKPKISMPNVMTGTYDEPVTEDQRSRYEKLQPELFEQYRYVAQRWD